MLIPTLRSPDVVALARHLVDVLGLAPGAVSAGHAELFWDDGAVLLGPVRDGDPFATGRAVTYLVVADPDAHHARVVATGGTVTTALTDQPYGSREFAATDPDGNVWAFGTYRPARPS
jgi:uncharacterized glyoxalase superfamily protein PhnB